MEKKQSVLLITDVNYWKLELGSHQRIYALIEYLKLHCDLTIAYVNEKQKEDIESINSLNHKVTFILDLHISSYVEEDIKIFFEQNPIIEEFYNEEVVSKLQTLLLENQFSHVLVEYIKLSYLFPLFKEKITILDTHDIMNKRNESFKKNNQKHWIDISEEEELKILSLYDKVICIQKIEYDYLVQKNIHSICCPHPVKTENFLQKLDYKEITKIIFIAGYSIANNHSIKWFLDTIWVFFKDIKNLQLNIYGGVSQALNGYEKKYTNLILHGKVNDLKEAYKDASIAINPVQMGGGLKIKNIEALAYGIPLITTNEGSKGLETQINSSFLLANTLDEWMEKIISLTISDQFRSQLSKNSINYISKYFNSDICFKDLILFINKNKK